VSGVWRVGVAIVDVLECVAVEDESKWFALWRFTAIDDIETVSTSWYSDGRRGRYHVCMQEYAINEYIRVAVVSSSRVGVQGLGFAVRRTEQKWISLSFLGLAVFPP
jgi:hypothetical protein